MFCKKLFNNFAAVLLILFLSKSNGFPFQKNIPRSVKINVNANGSVFVSVSVTDSDSNSTNILSEFVDSGEGFNVYKSWFDFLKEFRYEKKSSSEENSYEDTMLDEEDMYNAETFDVANIPEWNGELGSKINVKKIITNTSNSQTSKYETRPIYFDWRLHDAVSPVKDQGGCAACWAFSIVANVESMLKIYENRKETLSEKFLIDCETGSDGCRSSSILRAFGNIVANIGGILRSQDYNQYNGERNVCSWKRPGPPNLIPVTGFSRVKNDEDVMMKMLVDYGPLTAAINSKSMHNYGRNNYIDEPTEEQCPSDPASQDHSVLIVGYNVYVDQNTGHEVPYWIIKNSWGTGWGDQGFYYLVRGRNACGIANDVSYAKVN